MSTNKADHLYDDMIEELDSITGGPIPEKLLGLIEEMYSLADVEAERLREEDKYLSLVLGRGTWEVVKI
jgi:hypothetical protein